MGGLSGNPFHRTHAHRLPRERKGRISKTDRERTVPFNLQAAVRLSEANNLVPHSFGLNAMFTVTRTRAHCGHTMMVTEWE